MNSKQVPPLFGVNEPLKFWVFTYTPEDRVCLGNPQILEGVDEILDGGAAPDPLQHLMHGVLTPQEVLHLHLPEPQSHPSCAYSPRGGEGPARGGGGPARGGGGPARGGGGPARGGGGPAARGLSWSGLWISLSGTLRGFLCSGPLQHPAAVAVGVVVDVVAVAAAVGVVLLSPYCVSPNSILLLRYHTRASPIRLNACQISIPHCCYR